MEGWIEAAKGYERIFETAMGKGSYCMELEEIRGQYIVVVRRKNAATSKSRSPYRDIDQAILDQRNACSQS